MRLYTSLLAVLLVALLVGAAEEPAANPTAEAKRAPNVQVIAYYFHGTVRCETCLNIERMARDVIERRFAFEELEKRLVFKPLNYEKPENAHFLSDYKLPCPSLVLVRKESGKVQKWKLLDKTWELVENPIEFKEYLEREAGKLLNGTKCVGGMPTLLGGPWLMTKLDPN